MAELTVNPTRMELKKLKTKLTTAKRGHKLLKDKCDELMKQFLDTVREAKDLRIALSDRLSGVTADFEMAAADTDIRVMTEALMLPSVKSTVKTGNRNIMSVLVPTFETEDNGSAASHGGAGYGYAFTSKAMDKAADAVCAASADMVRLAELEKTASLLCREIERTRRRVNALEYIMIPQYEVTIKRIAMKLDENERSNLTRLMKVKDMMMEEKLRKKVED